MIRLRHGATWAVLTVIYGAIAGFGLVLVVLSSTEGEPVLAVIGAAAGTLGAAAISLLFLAGARRPPSLTIAADGGVVVDLPGVLREPLRIPQHQVRHVYMRDAYDIKDHRPRGLDWIP